MSAGAGDGAAEKPAAGRLNMPIANCSMDCQPPSTPPTPRGSSTFYNEAAVALWGRRPVLGKDRWCGFWKLFSADGTPIPHETCPMADCAQGKPCCPLLGGHRRAPGWNSGDLYSASDSAA